MEDQKTPSGKLQGIIVLVVIVGLIAVAVFTRGSIRERVGNWFSQNAAQSQPTREGIEKQLKWNQTERDKLARLLYSSPDIETGTGKINNTWIEQNTRDYDRRSGMDVYVDLKTNPSKGETYFISVYIFKEEDKELKGLGRGYNFGEIATITALYSPHKDGIGADGKKYREIDAEEGRQDIFIPSSHLDYEIEYKLKSGDTLKYVVVIWSYDTSNIIALSSRTFSFEERPSPVMSE